MFVNLSIRVTCITTSVVSPEHQKGNRLTFGFGRARVGQSMSMENNVKSHGMYPAVHHNKSVDPVD